MTSLGPAREPLRPGARWDGEGTSFAVYSSVADGVELCLFDEVGAETRVELQRVPGHWHRVHVPGVGPGQRYGFRVHGPWDPPTGRRCNPSKLLLDPYALAIEGEVRWTAAVYDYRHGDPRAIESADSARSVPRSVVVDRGFDWGDDAPPRVPREQSLIYETHVRGLTATLPELAPELRGTYAGVASEPVVDHLRRLGVTAVELLPVQHFIPERQHIDRGLTNYWGYSPIGFLAPHARYTSGAAADAPVREFKTMVRTLHQAGIEVILDVVFNHTAEGGPDGPSLCFRGLDNTTYYRLAEDRARYRDFTGVGNSFDARQPATLRLIMDALRYWVTEMHVDGFRFDLATTLARNGEGFEPHGPFLSAVLQDPVLSDVKLIAEPWDAAPDGYQLGGFPAPWSEWNDRYRDDVRDYWRGQGTRGAFASRLAGSSDIFDAGGRTPAASINFVACHDGFTLADVVAYDEKHNEANLEDGADGHNGNRSWNSGVEGPTSDATVLARRGRRVRAQLATLFVSQGVPMLLGGDELGRTQQGNNNAYCQDNEISWYDWASADDELATFVAGLAAFRAAHPVFRRTRWFAGDARHEGHPRDIGWYTAGGALLSTADWHAHGSPPLLVYLNGAIAVSDEDRPDDSFLVLCNPQEAVTRFTLPRALRGREWVIEIDSGTPTRRGVRASGSSIDVEGWTLQVMREVR
jgi:glycogen operon protein